MRTRAAAKEAGRDVILVRRLVFAETGIAINAIDGLGGVGGVFRGEALHRRIQGLHQIAHGLLHLLFERVLARLKPIAIIISLERSKELQGFRRKAGKTRAHRISPLKSRSCLLVRPCPSA